MDESKELVPATEETDEVDLADTETEQAPAPTKPEIKTAGKVAKPANGASNGLALGGSGSPLGRPLYRTRAKASRRRFNIWGWFLVLLLAVAAGFGTFYYVRSTQTNPAFQGQTTTATTRLPVSVSIASNGQVQANADVGVTFSTGGTLKKLHKKLGDTVQADEPLAEIDDTDLQNAVKSAQLSLDQQQATYKKSTEGATQKDLDIAQAQVDSAKANLNKVINGTFTAQDVASANASINSAATKLSQDQQGGSAQDIAAAQASISSSEASLASAKANLQKVLAGSDTAAITSAQASYDQAVANYDKGISQLKLSVTSAEVARDQALNALNAAQDKYQAAYNVNHNPDGTLKPALKQADIDAETAAYRALQDAQGVYNKSDIALNDARVQQDAQTKILKSQIDVARANLDKAKAGPTASDIASAQSQVASAQASLDNAKKSYAALTPTQAQLASDEASLASAQASLAKLRGGTPDDITSAEASLKQAEATLADLKAGPKPNDLAIAKAQLDVAQLNLDKAKISATNAVLKSPISGRIVTSPLTEGATVAASTVVYQVVDMSSLHIDVNVSETDISKIKEGMGVAVNLDGIPSRSFTGKVTFISTKATVTSNVVSYLTTVTLDQGSANSLFEAYQSEFNKLIQPQGQGQAGNRGTQGNNPGGAGGFPAGGNFQLPRGAAAQIASATGICGYNLAGLFNRGGNTAELTPKVGMTANVTFCLNLKAGVLAVPNRVIKNKVENGQRISYVEVLVDRDTNKIEQRPVLTGLAGDNYTEITGGNLKEGDQIVLSATPTNTTNRAGGNQGAGGGPGGGGAVVIGR